MDHTTIQIGAPFLDFFWLTENHRKGDFGRGTPLCSVTVELQLPSIVT